MFRRIHNNVPLQFTVLQPTKSLTQVLCDLLTGLCLCDLYYVPFFPSWLRLVVKFYWTWEEM